MFEEFVAHVCYFFSSNIHTRLLTLLMESKQEEQILLVHWENFLTMVMFVPLIVSSL